MLSGKERAYFKAAKAVSTLSDHRCQHGCVVISKHKIVSSGYNSKSRYHPIQARADQKYFNNQNALGCVHAELDALRPLINQKSFDFSTSTLYVYRQNKLGELANSRPCPRCMDLIRTLGIKKIHYTTDGGFASELVLKENI